MKRQRGIALITILVLMVVIFAFALAMSVVMDKNLKFFTFSSQKNTARSIANFAIDFMITKGGPANITWRAVSADIYSTDEIKINSNDPYYFEIRNINFADPNIGEYQFIGLTKDIRSGNVNARTVLRVIKPLPADFSLLRKRWIE